MTPEHVPGPCPYCQTTMINTGSPIWEDYCPNKSCTGQKDAFFARIRTQTAERAADERVRELAPEMLSALRFVACIDLDHFTEHDELLLEDAVRDARLLVKRAEASPAMEAS